MAQEEVVLSWVGCGISKVGFMQEVAAAYTKKTGTKIVIQGGGATRGIRQVSARQADMGGSCRDVIYGKTMISPIPEERWARMNPVAWDALVVIVHKDNPVTDISLSQIRQIYKNSISHWKQVGGTDSPIELYVRAGKISGVGQTIRELVFQNYNEVFYGWHVMPSSGPLEKAIEKNINGIAITGISSAKRRDVKILKLNGVKPTYDKIKDGGYTLYRPLYLVTPLTLDVNPAVKDFLVFIRSDEGKNILRKAGTVPYEDAIPTWLRYLKRREVAIGRVLSGSASYSR